MKKTRKQIEKERDCLNHRLETLNREEASLETDPVREVADALHIAFCHFKHDKDCSYYYEKWEHANTVKQKYVEKAIKLLKIADKDKVLEMIDVIKTWN